MACDRTGGPVGRQPLYVPPRHHTTSGDAHGRPAALRRGTDHRRRRGHRRGAGRRERAHAVGVHGPRHRRPVVDPGPAAPRGHLPQRGPGVHGPRRPGRGPREGPRRAVRLAGPGLSPATAPVAGAGAGDDGLPGGRPRARRVRAAAVGGAGAGWRGPAATSAWGERRSPPRPRPSCPVVDHRGRHVGPAGGHSACATPASRSPSWRRTRGWAARGGRTATPVVGWTWATTSTATPSRPSDGWTEFFAQPAGAAQSLLRPLHAHDYGFDRPHPLRHRGHQRPLGRGDRRSLVGWRDANRPDGERETLEAAAC
jgi:hypothetical protein